MSKYDFNKPKDSKNLGPRKSNGNYDFLGIEKKWQARWEKKKAFEVKESKKDKHYVLDMFPYPSGEGLHIGHAFVYTLGDVFARFKRLQGKNVLYPIGYDSLGLPAENAAIKAGVHPKDYTKRSMANFMKQQKAMGWSYDWSRIIMSHDPDFYKWDQWIFLKMLEKGVAYRKKAAVNFCEKCNTVLANEQVHDGKCWRHEDTDVEIKHLEQWFFRTTKYADQLLEGLNGIDWPQRAKTMQKNWIGKSYGTEIIFRVNGNPWKVFTTRPDTLMGVTFMVVSAQHPKLMELVTDKQKKEVEKFLKRIKTVSEKDQDKLNKEGAFTGSYAEHPLTKEKIPIWTGNFVVADYGSGMVMAVPSGDQRDYEFARKYKIPVKVVVRPENSDIPKRLTKAITDYGVLVNSGPFDGLKSGEAIEHITNALEYKKLGKKTVNYKLRDWLVSRQRYWGTPIPIIYCDACGVVPVPEEDLPVKLPEGVKFGKGNPLATSKKFLEVKCPKCNAKARRETDTMDTFVNSSWYYLRYTDPKNSKEIFDSKKANYWAPVDTYIGGPEHITMHLIYFRFYARFLNDLGVIDFNEPAKRYFTQGVIKGIDGFRMSKSRGNVIEPLETIQKYGADTLRLALLSFGSPDTDFNWDEKIVSGSHKFLNKVHDYFSNFKPGKKDIKIENKLNKSIEFITKDVETFKHNLSIIKIRQLFDSFSDKDIDKKTAEGFLKLLHIYCPFLTEELWEKLGNKNLLSLEEWPKAGKVDMKLIQAEEALEKTMEDINHIINLIKEKEGKEANKIFIYTIPPEKGNYDEKLLSKRFNKEVKVFAGNDKDKYDPENKSGKAKPGRPAIYLE